MTRRIAAWPLHALAMVGVLVPCVLTDSGRARADVASAVVDDAAAIIQQLIENTIATQAVPNAASKVPATCFYFPSTVGAIEDKRYSALSKIIRKEIADAAGYAVYTSVMDVTEGQLTTPPRDLRQDAVRELEALVLPRSLKTGASVPPAQTPTKGSPTLTGFAQTSAGLVIDPQDPHTGKPALQRQCYFGTKADGDQRGLDVDARKTSVKVAADKVLGESTDAAANKAFTDGESALEAAISATRTDYSNEEGAVNAALARLAAKMPGSADMAALKSAENELDETIGTPVVGESIATGLLRLCVGQQAGDVEVACSVALLVRDAANGDTGLLSPDAKRIVTALLTRILTKVDQTLKITATNTELEALATAIATADATGVVNAMKAICRQNATCSLWLDGVAAVGAPIDQQPAAIGAWTGKVAMRLGLPAVKPATSDAFVKALVSNDDTGLLASVTTICAQNTTCTGLFKAIAGAISGHDELLSGWLTQVATVLGLNKVTDAQLEALVRAIAANDAAAEVAALKDICAASNVCSGSMAALQAAGLGQGAVTFEQLLALTATLAQNYGKADPTCKYCSLISTLADGADGVLKDIQNGDYGSAAGATFDVVENMACNKDLPSSGYDASVFGCAEGSDKLVFTFLRSLAVYSIDTATAPSGTAQSADADFRNAAVDLIEEYGGLGVRRSLRWSPLPGLNALLIPELSLRDAWRPGLVRTDINASAGSQIIFYPSLDMLRWRGVISSRTIYVGVHGSFVDPLGPFVELALRSQNIANAQANWGVPFLAAVVPRIDLEFAVPDISKNLVVGTGGAFRLFRSEGTPASARYCVLGASDPQCRSNGPTGDNLELGLFVKYVP